MKIRFPVEYDRQLQQFLDSYLRVHGHEPSAEQIAAFESRQYVMTPRDNSPRERQGLASCTGEARTFARQT